MAHNLNAVDGCRSYLTLFGAVGAGVVGATGCVEINQCVGCTRQFFTKSFLGDDAAVRARSSGEEPASPRHRAGVASMAWRSTRTRRTILISTQATGLRGLLFFVGTYVLGSVALLTRMRCNPVDYTSESLTKFVITGAPGYALSFVLFWTLAYALVHIY